MTIAEIFSNFPTFRVGNYILQEINPEHDAERYLNYMNHHELKSVLSDGVIPHTIEGAMEELQYWYSLFHFKRSFYWSIYDPEHQYMIGTIGFNNISTLHRRADISYDLDYSYWNKGIMFQSMNSVIDFVITKLNIHRIQASTPVHNKRSIRLLKKCLFHEEGKLKQYEYINGTKCDFYMFARLVR